MRETTVPVLLVLKDPAATVGGFPFALRRELSTAAPSMLRDSHNRALGRIDSRIPQI
jgi:hypothetical protein